MHGLGLDVEGNQLRKQLEQQLTEQNLHDRAVFTGVSEQPLAMIALMDLVVQPSLNEAFSRTMVESLALGNRSS